MSCANNCSCHKQAVKSVDWTKPVETEDGHEVVVLTTKRKHLRGRCVLVQIKGVSDEQDVFSCNLDGTQVISLSPGGGSVGMPDIRNKVTKKSGWINIYRDTRAGNVYPTKEKAQQQQAPACVACIEIHWEE